MSSPPNGLETLLLFTLLQLILIILAARLIGWLFQRLQQPRGVGEIVAGLLLGPSLFGTLAPETFHWLFRSIDGTALTLMSQIGLILLMFQVGMEFDFSQLGNRANRRITGAVTAVGILLPFMLGFGFGQVSAPWLAPGISHLAYSLFIAIAFSITAVPILGRILMEFGLTRHRLGVITIAAAAANDAIGWVLLAVVAAVASSQFSWPILIRQVALLITYLLASWVIVRPLLHQLVRQFPIHEEKLPQDLLALLLAIVFASATVTSQLGIFAIFGGFTAGVLLHDRHALVTAWRNRVEDLLAVFFLPIFFTYTGLRTDIGSLATADQWLWCGALIALATLGKFGGCYLAARASGMNRAESRCIGVMMNTRALMELIVINLGRDMGVIPAEVFTMLVLMAVISTLLTSPGLRRWLPEAGITDTPGRSASLTHHRTS
jgi:Kef-type K+ transport system membrane component KefB